jgi:hypothetical protein
MMMKILNLLALFVVALLIVVTFPVWMVVSLFVEEKQ